MNSQDNGEDFPEVSGDPSLFSFKSKVLKLIGNCWER